MYAGLGIGPAVKGHVNTGKAGRGLVLYNFQKRDMEHETCYSGEFTIEYTHNY